MPERVNPYLFILLTCLASGLVAVWLGGFVRRRVRKKQRKARRRAVVSRARRLRSEFVTFLVATIGMTMAVVANLSSTKWGQPLFVVWSGVALTIYAFMAITSGRSWLKARAEAAEIEDAPEPDAEHPDFVDPRE